MIADLAAKAGNTRPSYLKISYSRGLPESPPWPVWALLVDGRAVPPEVAFGGLSGIPS